MYPLKRSGAFRVLIAVLAAALAAGAAAAPPPPAPGASCLIVPFSNRSGDSGLDWLGESFVVSLRQGLAGSGVAVMTQAERNRARQLVGAAAGVTLSHATLIRMADAAGARWLVTGWYDYDGETLRAQADVIDLRREHLTRPALEQGQITDLEKLQAALGKALRGLVAPGAAAAAAPPPLPLPAYEDFIRARLAPEGAGKIALLQVAMRLSPSDSRVALALGRAEWAAQHDADALYWLQRIPPGAPEYAQAQFTAGLAAYRLGHFDDAAKTFQALTRRLPLPAVMHNLALAQTRAQGRPAPGELETAFPAAGYRQLARAVARASQARWQALPPAQRIQAELEQGEHLQRQGAWAGATQAYQAVLAAAPPDSPALAAAHAGLAQVWWARHDRARAGREARAALALDPANAAALEVQKKLGAAHE